jgi:hypothetical protein
MNERVEDQPAPSVQPEWRERVEVEFKELGEKMQKLSAFLDKVESGAQKLDPVTHGLLISQHGAMTAYHGILFIRLNTAVQAVAELPK